MATLFSQRAEMAMIRTITSDKIPEKYRAAFLGKVDQTFFHTPAAKKAFKRISKLAGTKQVIPTWDDIVDDPSFDADVREVLDSTDVLPVQNKKKVKSLIGRLDKYRQLRELYDMVKAGISYFDQKEALDPEELANDFSDRLTHARKNHSVDQKIWTFGVGSNAKEIVQTALHKPSERMYKTGFIEYDEKNGGLPTTGVMLLAGTTSGGKSVLANNLLSNLTLNNKGIHGVKVTLEMTAEQETNRILSMITGIPFWKYKQRRLSKDEKRQTEKMAAAYNKRLKENKSKFSFVSPEGSMTVDDVLNMLKPYGYNIIVLDYISLLEGVDDDNQWRMLSSIARKMKVYGTENKTLCIILCQLDGSTSQLRYSKGIKEHADVMWAWNYTDPEQRALKILPVKVEKARDGELFPLDLLDEFEIMRVSNPKGLEEKSGSKSKFGKRPRQEKQSDSDDGSDHYVMS